MRLNYSAVEEINMAHTNLWVAGSSPAGPTPRHNNSKEIIMNKITIYAVTAAVSITFIIEEVRAFRMLKEFERRFNEQRVLHASLGERIEMLEEDLS